MKEQSLNQSESGVILTEFGFLAILVMVGCAWLADLAFSVR
ncbi:putative membrane protein [Escherichia coli P0304799.3]|nr:putative membrane protein [Escherichia coli P0304799.3]